MRLKKDKITSTKPIITKRAVQAHHNKTSSMEVVPANKSKNIYLNKILQKNFGDQKLPMEPSHFKENYPNFQANIQNILADEESRQKAKNFVLRMRNKQVNSPLTKSEYNRNNYSKTYYDFYDYNKKKGVVDIAQERSNYKSKNYQKSAKKDFNNNQIQYSNNKNYIDTNDQRTPDRYIKVNKINKYYEEMPFNPGEGNAYIRNNLGNKANSRVVFNPNNVNYLNNNNINNNVNSMKNANTSYPLGSTKKQLVYYHKKPYVDNSQYYDNNYNNVNNFYNDENENEFEEGYINDNYENIMDTNSMSDNNSGLRDPMIDNMNEAFQSPQAYNRKYDDYGDEGGYKYPNILDNNEYNVNNYNYNNDKFRPGARSKSKNKLNLQINANNKTPNAHIKNRNKTSQRTYYMKSNIGSVFSTGSNKNLVNTFNDKLLEIERNQFKINAQKQGGVYNTATMQKIKNKFLEYIQPIAINEFTLQGNVENKRGKTRSDIYTKTNTSSNLNEIRQLKIELQMAKKKNKDNDILISNLEEIISNQKRELDSRLKEKSKIKINFVDNELKLKNNISNIENKYNSLLNENKNLNEEIIRLRNELQNTKNRQQYGDRRGNFNKLDDEEYMQLNEKINELIEENTNLKNDNKNLI